MLGAACDSDPSGPQAPCLPPPRRAGCRVRPTAPFQLSCPGPSPHHCQVPCIAQAEAAAASGGHVNRGGASHTHPCFQAAGQLPLEAPTPSQSSVPTNGLALAKHTIGVKRPFFVACRYDGSRSGRGQRRPRLGAGKALRQVQRL